MDVLKINYTSPDAAVKFCHSLNTTGFAVIVEHPIPADLVARVYQQWARFFNSVEKHDFTFNPEKQSGFFPFRTENAKDYNIKDLKEFFHVYPNCSLPDYLKKDTEELYRRLIDMGNCLLTWLQEQTPEEVRKKFSIKLPEMSTNSIENLLRVIHYPPLKGNEEQGAIRAAAHEDINLITLLCSATSPGLEVMDAKGLWHTVPCDPGSVVINAGDMLQLASQGYYKSTPHRVVNPFGAEAQLPRYSLPLFLHPRPEVVLAEGITAKMYLKQRLKEIGLLKK